MNLPNPLSSDKLPYTLHVGAANPYALVEALLGMRLDQAEQMNDIEMMTPGEPQHALFMIREQLRERRLSVLTPKMAKVITDTLQCDYDELFDMKYNSVLYAGLRLNPKDHETAEPIPSRDMQNLTEDDMVTPDLSRVRKLSDLHDIGLKDIGETKVKIAVAENGNLRLVLQPTHLGKKYSNHAVTATVGELMTPFRKGRGEWVPPNCDWEDIGDRVRPVATCNIPVQGAVGNSYFVAALFAVHWSDPYAIVHAKLPSMGMEKEKEKEKAKGRTLSIKFHSKGGEMDSPTSTVEVDFEVPVNKSSGQPICCHSNGLGEIWPSLYEKAFAKWVTRTNSEHPDITQTCYGDPVKAMAQLNDKTPHYFLTKSRSPEELVGLVRENSVAFRTIIPMTAWTHPTGKIYRGANLVANMAYTVLGFACPQGATQYIIVRNPWGVTERTGLATYPGISDSVEPEFWRPASMLDRGGVFALEANAFKEAFAGIGMAK